ncbi:MAG: hypothetical protein KC468_32865, partial [Myxococcales bacterium]|nr:hypothetical protein [Myxococcales bacterium]
MPDERADIEVVRRRVLMGAGAVIGAASLLSLIPRSRIAGAGPVLTMLVVLIAVCAVVIELARRGTALRATSLLFCLIFAALLVGMQVANGAYPTPVAFAFPVVPALAGFLLGGAYGMWFGVGLSGAVIALSATLPATGNPLLLEFRVMFVVVPCIALILIPALVLLYDRAHAHARTDRAHALKALERSVDELARARARADLANTAKTEFLATMSH